MKSIINCIRYTIALVVAMIGMGALLGESESLWITFISKPFGILMIAFGIYLSNIRGRDYDEDYQYLKRNDK